jgi:hypothetical protein
MEKNSLSQELQETLNNYNQNHLLAAINNLKCNYKKENLIK